MTNNIQVEFLYESRKKSMLLAYVLGGVFGGFGAHYFYCGRKDLGICVLVLLVLSFSGVSASLGILHAIVVLVGLFHTSVVVTEVNGRIREECEALVEK